MCEMSPLPYGQPPFASVKCSVFGFGARRETIFGCHGDRNRSVAVLFRSVFAHGIFHADEVRDEKNHGGKRGDDFQEHDDFGGHMHRHNVSIPEKGEIEHTEVKAIEEKFSIATTGIEACKAFIVKLLKAEEVKRKRKGNLGHVVGH